jgi:hypothetical protein
MSVLITVIGLTLALVVLTALICGLIFFVQYCNSAEKQWANQVLSLLGDTRRKYRAEKKAYEGLDEEERVETASITEKAFRRFLSHIGVNQLQAYDGIGPGTVAKLSEAGYHNLDHIRGARIRIHGLGEKRLSDIDTAVRDLVKKALRDCSKRPICLNQGHGKEAIPHRSYGRAVEAHRTFVASGQAGRATAQNRFTGGSQRAVLSESRGLSVAHAAA